MKNKNPFAGRDWTGPSLSFWFGTLIFIALAIQFILLWFRDFDPDEFQHLHAAWCISKGLIPYVDFFEHHPPGFWFLLAPLVRFFHPETDFASTLHLLFACRVLMLGISAVILLFTWKLERLWRGDEQGGVAAVLLAYTLMFLEKCIETRVDVPAPAALMACFYILFKAFKSQTPGKKADFALSGLLFGCAFILTQKLLMVVPGILMALGWYVLDDRIEGGRKRKFSRSALFWACSLIPLLVVLVYFQAHNAVYDFFYNNFILNSNWRMRFSPSLTFNKLLRQNSITTIMGIAGFLATLAAAGRREAVRRGDFLLIFPFASFVVGAFVMPVPQREYFMEFLPLGALFAAYALTGFLEAFSTLGRANFTVSKGEILCFRILVLTTGACSFLIIKKHLQLVDLFGLRLAIFLILTSAAAAALLRSTRWPKIIALAGLSFYGARQAVQYSEWTNYETLNQLRFVDQHVAPTETVMDGWNGVGVFRPNAWRYYFFHTEILYMLDQPQVQELVDGFKSGAIAPKVIFLDEFIKAISPRLTDYLRKNYVATLSSERGTFLIRRSKPFSAKKSAYAPAGRSKLPLPGAFELVVQK